MLHSEFPERVTQKHVNPWLIAFAVMFATFMEVLDTTVVNVSLPHIASSLSATTDEASYSSGVAANINGRRAVVFLTRTNLIALEPATGKVLFQKRWRALQAASPRARRSRLEVGCWVAPARLPWVPQALWPGHPGLDRRQRAADNKRKSES